MRLELIRDGYGDLGRVGISYLCCRSPKCYPARIPLK
jgi:hypothetical protein